MKTIAQINAEHAAALAAHEFESNLREVLPELPTGLKYKFHVSALYGWDAKITVEKSVGMIHQKGDSLFTREVMDSLIKFGQFEPTHYAHTSTAHTHILCPQHWVDNSYTVKGCTTDQQGSYVVERDMSISSHGMVVELWWSTWVDGKCIKMIMRFDPDGSMVDALLDHSHRVLRSGRIEFDHTYMKPHMQGKIVHDAKTFDESAARTLGYANGGQKDVFSTRLWLLKPIITPENVLNVLFGEENADHS